MNFDQFVIGFQNPEPKEGEPEQEAVAGGEEEENLVLAGVILTATKESCCIEINGCRYELDAEDVIDIKVLPTGCAEGEPEPSESPEQKAPEEEEEKEEEEEASSFRANQVVMLEVKRDAVLRQQVPAVLLAAMGTWMSLEPA